MLGLAYAATAALALPESAPDIGEAGSNWGWIFAGLTLVWGIASFVIMLRVHANRVTKDEIDDLKTRLERLETTVEGLPTSEMVHQIDKEITALSGRINVATEMMKPMAASIARIDNFMMTHSWTKDPAK